MEKQDIKAELITLRNAIATNRQIRNAALRTMIREAVDMAVQSATAFRTTTLRELTRANPIVYYHTTGKFVTPLPGPAAIYPMSRQTFEVCRVLVVGAALYGLMKANPRFRLGVSYISLRRAMFKIFPRGWLIRLGMAKSYKPHARFRGARTVRGRRYCMQDGLTREMVPVKWNGNSEEYIYDVRPLPEGQPESHILGCLPAYYPKKARVPKCIVMIGRGGCFQGEESTFIGCGIGIRDGNYLVTARHLFDMYGTPLYAALACTLVNPKQSNHTVTVDCRERINFCPPGYEGKEWRKTGLDLCALYLTDVQWAQVGTSKLPMNAFTRATEGRCTVYGCPDGVLEAADGFICDTPPGMAKLALQNHTCGSDNCYSGGPIMVDENSQDKLAGYHGYGSNNELLPNFGPSADAAHKFRMQLGIVPQVTVDGVDALLFATPPGSRAESRQYKCQSGMGCPGDFADAEDLDGKPRDAPSEHEDEAEEEEAAQEREDERLDRLEKEAERQAEEQEAQDRRNDEHERRLWGRDAHDRVFRESDLPDFSADADDAIYGPTGYPGDASEESRMLDYFKRVVAHARSAVVSVSEEPPEFPPLPQLLLEPQQARVEPPPETDVPCPGLAAVASLRSNPHVPCPGLVALASLRSNTRYGRRADYPPRPAPPVEEEEVVTSLVLERWTTIIRKAADGCPLDGAGPETRARAPCAELDAAILGHLARRATGSGKTRAYVCTLELAEAAGMKTKADINPYLFAMVRRGLIKKQELDPPGKPAWGLMNAPDAAPAADTAAPAPRSAVDAAPAADTAAPAPKAKKQQQQPQQPKQPQQPQPPAKAKAKAAKSEPPPATGKNLRRSDSSFVDGLLEQLRRESDETQLEQLEAFCKAQREKVPAPEAAPDVPVPSRNARRRAAKAEVDAKTAATLAAAEPQSIIMHPRPRLWLTEEEKKFQPRFTEPTPETVSLTAARVEEELQPNLPTPEALPAPLGPPPENLVNVDELCYTPASDAGPRKHNAIVRQMIERMWKNHVHDPEVHKRLDIKPQFTGPRIPIPQIISNVFRWGIQHILECTRYDYWELVADPCFREFMAYLRVGKLERDSTPADREYRTSDGKVFMEKIGAGPRQPGSRKAKTIQLSTEFVAACIELGLDDPEVYGKSNICDETSFVLPGGSPSSLLDSLQCQCGEMIPGGYQYSEEELASIDLTDSHFPTYTTGITGSDFLDVIQGYLDTMDRTKSSGYAAFYLPGTKDAWLKDEEMRCTLVIFAIQRLMLRLVCSDDMPNMSPAEMFALGLVDPRIPSGKKEATGKGKQARKAWRIIWIVSILDALCLRLIHKESSKADQAAYQSGENIDSMIGLSHEHDGVQAVGKVLEQIAEHDGTVTDSDAQGFDMSVKRCDLMFDQRRRMKSLRVESRTGDLAVCWLLYLEGFTNSSHVLLVDGVLYGLLAFGITASGVDSTSSQNGYIRSMKQRLAGAVMTASMGDDNACAPVPDYKILEKLGLRTKMSPPPRTSRIEEGVDLTSHHFTRDAEGVWHAEFLNFTKLLAGLELKRVAGESPRPDHLSGCFYAIRNSPENTEILCRLCAAMSWDVPETCGPTGVDMD